ncbi:MAG TPA: CsbD family protein [Terriglobales bacterium]|nr:CsbD family protein [Terriglobales bacterium]
MDNDQVKGKIKDIAGAAERKVGEWTGDKETEAKGAGKQVEGKAQNAWGTVKDAVKHPPQNEDDENETERRDRAVNE